MTVYMVRRGTLRHFVFLEHGAHYTVFMLAVLMFTSALIHIPELIPGLVGIGIIGASIAASIRVSKLPPEQRRKALLSNIITGVMALSGQWLLCRG